MLDIPTTTYTVGNRDTLTSVAARFDTTPSELTQLNRLSTSFIYPGQQLLVPDKKARRSIGDGAAAGSTNEQSIDNRGLDGVSGSTEFSASGKSSPTDRKLSAADEQTNKGNGKC